MKHWKHKDFPKRVYKGSYVTVKGVRKFRLTTKIKIIKTRIYHMTFNSWQEAVKKGWKR